MGNVMSYDTSELNTLILLAIIGLSVTIYLNIKKSAPAQLSKLNKTYENLCSDGLNITIPNGSLVDKKYPVIGRLTIPDNDTSIKININCD